MGVSAIKFKKKGDDLVSICPVAPNDEVMVVTESGVIVRMDAASVTAQSRTATGVLVQKAAKDDALVDLTVVPADLLRATPRAREAADGGASSSSLPSTDTPRPFA
ncbi:DNA topoisomerase type II [Aureococcus anophagefferens]|nr:DNA topoisomerase type II [Aureococcus anophagefferens]